MTYFIADTHFGHSGIISLCDRPFANADEMDMFMVEMWNNKISGNDTVYIVGDMFYKHIPDILHTLFKLKHRGKLVFAFICTKAAAGKYAYFPVPVFKLDLIWLCALNYGIAFIPLQRKINNLVFRIVVISSFGRFGAHFHAFKVAEIKTGIISSCYCFSISGFRRNKPKLYFFFGKRFSVKGNKM